jgi:hypothetical protein
MQRPPRDPPVKNLASTAPILTAYNGRHMVTYLRLRDAEAAGADWEDAARFVLYIDRARKPERAGAWESHLALALGMTENGYRRPLQGRAPR